MIWLIISTLLAASVIWLAYLVKKEKLKQKELRNDYHQELEALKELQKASRETAATQFDEQVMRMNESYQREIEKLIIENEEIRKNFRNQGEILTHQILENFKADLISKKIIPADEMIIMPNIFIPEGNGTTRQIDHLVLLSTGLYVIETKDWTGHIVLGLTRMGSHKFSFLAELVDSEKEESIVFNRDESGALKVITYENPICQIQQSAISLSNYLEGKDIPTWINPLLFFNDDEKEVHDWSDHSIVKRLTNKEQLQQFFIHELTTKNRLYGAFQLNNIKHIIENAHYI
ncbi:nuclease-related domain-containing protein [Neobacillus sp. OS1-33]|uniref:nuclease-related domain-containing protein n=1 Tax=Neobacillus sp. OS1-33 TaxID=3070683 RepID=UPI0027DF7587|nr:nuclease-related domain-containing protein [Neobacillus sp. OS1-33]WML26758.1 nuclease-related domain-containing protein [Neobacillus sp. OS1-33]